MRFILNFILFGILFYLIYLFFPEAFNTLVSWANKTYAFLQESFNQISHKVQSQPDRPPNREEWQAIFGWLTGRV